MNEQPTTPEPKDDLTLPLALVAALRRTDSPGAALAARAPGADAEFLVRAQAEMAATRQAAGRHRWRLVWWGGGTLLAAASAALVVTLSLRQSPVRPRTGDIRDAFALACALRDKAPLSKADDFNHDGSVDANDVRALAMAAVSLKGGR